MMVAFSAALLLLVNLPSWIVLVAASSTMPRPVRIIDHPTTHSLQIIPRTEYYPGTLRRRDFPLDSPFLRHDDSLRITLTAFDQTFHLHLKPHEEFLHPAARVTYYKTPSGGGDPVVDRVEPLLREAVKVYQGEVVHEDHTDQRIKEALAGGVFKHHGTKRPGEIGWARIMINDQGDPETGREPEYEGAFSYHGVVHHITTKASYLQKKLPFDPEPFDGPQTELVVFRDSDMVSHEEEEALRRGVPLERVVKKKFPPPRCSHDRLGYNVDTQKNPVLRFGSGLDRAPSPPWYDPLGYTLPDPWSEAGRNMSKAVKRQGDAQGGSGGSNFIDKIGQIAGCPKSQKIVYIGVAADCEYVRASGGVSNATNNILKNFNTVSLLFKSTFNVSVGIIELLVQPPECPATATKDLPWNTVCNSQTLNERLSTFSSWRGAKGEDGAGLWHLMSACPTGTEVGVAWLGTLCLDKAGGQPPSVVSGTAVSTASKSEWQIIAHEMGHNFGAIHDCAEGCKNTDACCPLSQNTCNANAGFIMSPVSSTKEEDFSACSIGNVCSLMLGTSMDLSCVVDPDPTKRVFSLQQCGNGVVEAGEDCDPGSGPNAASSPCCDAATCKFKLGAQCDPASSPCCTSQCRFAPTSQVCRPARDDQCDVPEVCSGLSASCPTDKTMPNGQGCGKSSDGLACANGLCTSISQQCKTVGAALKLSQACTRPNDQSCQVACLDPKNSNQCIVLQSQLIDGSPCGFGGTCFGGSCKAGTLLQTAIAWYTQNLAISIPVTVVVGIIVLLILYALISCAFRCCRRKKAPIDLGPPAIPKNMRGARINSNPVAVPPGARGPGGPLGPPGPPPSGPPPPGPPPGQYPGGPPPMQQYPGGQPQMQYGGPPVLPPLYGSSGHATNGRFMTSWDGGRGSPMPGQHGRMMSHDSRSSAGSSAPLRAATPQSRRIA